MHPNIAGATVQGIFMTMPLGFDVRCFYDDNFDLTIDDIYIDSDQVDMGAEDGAIEGDGDVSTVIFETTEISKWHFQFKEFFSIHAYSSDDYSDDITSDDRVSIGADVYLEIKENKQIPNNLEFFLKDCTGYNDINDPKSYADASFPFVQVRTNQRDEIFI